MANSIPQLEPPAIPLAEDSYTRPNADQQNAVFRLFFNRISAILNNILSSNNGGKYTYVARGTFYDTTDQTPAVADTAYSIDFDTTGISSDISVVSNSQLTVVDDGTYQFRFTGRLVNSAANVAIAVWVSKNGTDEVYSARRIKMAGASDETTVSWGATLVLSAGDYVEAKWAADSTSVTLDAATATGAYPAIPSVTAEVLYVSNG